MKQPLVLLLVLVLLLASMSPLISVRAQDAASPWPFISYYSYVTGSWVIERADGSDGYTFGAGLNCGDIFNTDWSPSGDWLLWHCETRDLYYASNWIALNPASDHHLTALELFTNMSGDYLQVQWSPVDDLLLVTTLWRPQTADEEREWGPTVYLVDAAQDAIIFEQRLDEPISYAGWSSDGRFVLVRTDTREGDVHVTAIPVDGSAPFSHADVLLEQGSTFYGLGLIWTPDHRLVDQDEAAELLVLEDLGTGAREELPFTTTPLDRASYNPNGTHGLLYAGSELWLHTVATGELTLIVDDAVVLPTRPHYFPDEQPSFELPGWSPDGSRALFATINGDVHWLYPDGSTATLDLLPIEADPMPFPRVQWGGDLAFILWDGVVHIYDPATESALAVFDKPNRDSFQDPPPTLDAQVSPDGRYLAHAPGGYYGYYIWEWAEDRDTYLTPNRIIPEDARQIYSAARWSPDGNVLFVQEYVEQAGPGLSRWSVASADGSLLRALSAVQAAGAPQALPERVDTSFVTPSSDPLIPEPALQIALGRFEPGDLSWSPDGRYLAAVPSTRMWQGFMSACTGGGAARIFDAETGVVVAKFGVEGCGCGYAPQDDGTPDDNRLRNAYLSFDPDALRQSTQAETAYRGTVTGLYWPPTDDPVVALTIEGCIDSYTLVLWDFIADGVVAEIPAVSAAAFSADGTQIALGFQDGRVVLTTYPDLTQEDALITRPTRIDHLEFSADGSRLLITSAYDWREEIDSTLAVWDAADAALLFEIMPNPARDAVKLSPDGSTLVMTAQEYRCGVARAMPPTLLDAVTGDALNEPNSGLLGAAFSPDGRYVTGVGCGVVVWDVATWDVVADFFGNGVEVVWSPDGTQLATTTRFGIYVWDMP